MKKLLVIIVLGLLLSGNAYGLEREVCAKYVAKAKSEVGAKAIWGACLQEKNTNYFTRSKRFKCGLKASKAKTNVAAKVLWSTCMQKKT